MSNKKAEVILNHHYSAFRFGHIGYIQLYKNLENISLKLSFSDIYAYLFLDDLSSFALYFTFFVL
jgi:hypothetical protein